MQYVKSVSGTWHKLVGHVLSADGSLRAQTDCDRLVKVARISNTRVAMLNVCCDCRWHQQRSE
jgi:hypothetical protein